MSARLSRSLWLGAGLTLIFVGAALVSYLWTPFDVTAMDIPNKLKPPSAAHWFGTDHFGRDIFSMIMVGARTSIAVALVAVGIGMALGVPLGLAAAARSGSLMDEVIMRGNDLVFAFPALLIAIMITAVFGASAVNAIIAIGIFNIPVFARLTRGGALSLWKRDYILSARVSGKGAARISLEHILPNIANLLIVQGTIQFSLGILAEAGLSYVGLGAQPPTPSWGRMLADAQTLISLAPHIAIFPGLAIVFTALSTHVAAAASWTFVAGVGTGVAYVTGFTHLHSVVTDEIRGRAFAALFAAARAALLVSFGLAGIGAVALDGLMPGRLGSGIRAVMTVGGVVIVSSGLATLWAVRSQFRPGPIDEETLETLREAGDAITWMRGHRGQGE